MSGPNCLIVNDKIRELTRKIYGETESSIKTVVELWQQKNNKSIDEYPEAKELSIFIHDIRSEEKISSSLNTKIGWARIARNNYEVSSQGDKRFSALYATFKEGTIIDGEDVGGKTIEWVYQNIIKKSGKGKAPSKDSKLFIPSREGYKGDITPSEDTIFVFGSNPEGRHGAGAARVAKDKFGAQYGVGEGLTGNAYALPTKDLRVKENKGLRSISKESIIESIKTLYKVATENPGKQFKVAFRNKLDETTLNGYTGEEMIDMFLSAGPIPSNIIFSEEWLNTGKFNLSKQEIEDFSYEKGYLPLWQEWAKQNPELIEELRKATIGKTLTDKFASTRVSQARALSDILNIEKSKTSEIVIQENKQVKTNLLESFTPAKGVTSLEEQRQVDLTFDPMTRRNRVTAITRLFSLQVTMALEEIKQNLESRIENSNNPDEINSLMEELESLDRKSVISKLKPGGIFRRVLKIYKDYLEDSLEGRIESELNTINQREQEYKELYPDFEGFSIEEKRASAERKAKYKSIEYQKIIDNFKALAEEACPELEFTEDLKVTLDSIGINKANIEEEINEDQDLEQEVAYKDGWMTNFRFVSAQNSLSAAVRKVINTIPKLDYEGKYDEDDLGNQKYLDPQYVHATLIDKLRYMTSSKDMMPLLKKLAQTKPWVEQIIELLEEDDVLKSQFYRDFRKDFVNYWIIKKKLTSGGSYTYETIPINKPEGIYYLLEEWRDNYDSGVILDVDSVYRKDGTINISKAEKGLEYVKNLQVKMQNLSSNEEKLEELAKPEVFNTVVKLLHMLGINTNIDILEAALYNDKSTDKIKYTAPITLLLGNLDVIYSKIVAGEMNPVIREDGTEERKDLINTFGGAYNAIALMLAEVTEDAIESNVRENDKNYYSHVTPSYLGKLIKKLKNVIGDEESFQEYIEKEFKQYSWFYKDGYWRNDWLRDLITNPNKRQLLDHKVVLNMDKVAYTDWDSLNYTIAMLTEYWSDPNGKSAWYHVPILSDAPSAEFIKFNRYTTGSVLDEQGNKMFYENIILDRMADIVSQEYDRIILVRQRDAEYQKGNPKITQIANYDIKRNKEGKIVSLGGAEFKFFPYLNTLKLENGKIFLEELESRIKDSNDKDASSFKSFIIEELRKMMDSQFEATFKKWEKIGLLDKVSKESKVFKYLPQKSDKTAKEALREYFYNSKLATSQIIQLTTTDLAFYKDIEDFQKRFKEIHAPSLRLNTEAVFNGVKVGREWERTIYIADDEIASSIANDVYSIIYGKYKNGEMSAYDAAYIISKFGYSNYEDGNKKYVKIDNAIVETSYVNVADAQAYRSLSSYRAVMIMGGEWTTEHEIAYENLQSNKWTASDFRTIWQTQKPFVYTQINNESGIENKNGDIEGIKTPVQHKNSEFLLLAMHELISGPLGKSSKLRAINKFMEDHQLDVVQFESTTKVGKQGVIDLSDVNSEADVIKRLELATGINAGGENPNVVHKISYEDYGKQTATPEHIIDVEQLVGTQIRKLITADISDDAIIEVNDKKLTKKEWLDLYQAIITENIIQSFVEVDKIFKDPKKVEEILQDFLRDNRRYGDDIRRACVYNEEKGSFNIPFYDPVISQTIQQILNSIIKNRITKQKIRGGACIQVSNYGLTEELSIVFKDSKGNLLNWESYKKKYKNATRQEYKDFIKKAREEGSLAIAYFECYMPAYSKEFYEPLMKPETQELDIEKLPEDLRRAVGYRVPTEDKYSMIPIRIKGFLPQQNGSAIMLPAEITTLSGSDFDVDKLYIMLPEFKVQKYDMLRARQNYAKINAIFEKSMKVFNNSQLAQDLLEEDPQDFKEWFNENKETYRLEKPKISKVKYDHSKLPQDNSRDARNNLMIDLIYGVLTNPDTASKMLNPGGFDPQKKADRILNILHSIRREELMRILRISDSRKILSTLQNLSIEQLTKLAKKTKEQLDPLSPYTQITLHNLNMTGAKLIGIYANHNANHALMQHTELALNDNGSFILNGKKLTSLHDIKNIDGNYISRNNAGFLAASVDNAKDPTLAGLNQNTFTADASMLLSRLGYNALEIGLLMTQPIVLDITQKFFRESREGKTKEAIIEEVIAKYKKSAGRMLENSYESYKNQDFKAEDLADYILTSQYIGNIKDASQTSNYSDIEYYKKQVAVGYLFSRILTSADALGELTQATRSDTQGGAAGPTIADTWNKVMKVQDLFESMESKNFPLKGINFIDTTRFDGNINNLRRDLLNNPLPFLQAFFSLGILETEGMLSRYFPHYNESFSNALDALRKETRLGKLDSKSINNIINDLFAYIMSKTEFFGADSRMTAYEKREIFINDFPKYFKEVTANNSDIASLEFIKRLKYVKANDNNPVGTIQFKNVGRLNYTLKERYTRDWVSLLYMKNPEAKKLALNLFLYSYYRNGFAFGPSTFIHLAPIALRVAIPDYMETLENVLNSKDDFYEFVNQYIENHLDNRRFTPEIKEGTTVSFVNEKKEPLDKVQFYIHKESSIEDKGCVKQVTINEDGSQSYIFFNHIAKKHGNSYIYYRLLPRYGNIAIYERITPLGVKNNFIEYEYGVDVRDMKTSVKLKERYISRKERNLDDGSDNITPEEIDSKVREFDNESFSKEALELSYGIVFGESINTERQLSDNDIMTILPNEDYSDANGLKLCKSGNFGNSNIIAEL